MRFIHVEGPEVWHGMLSGLDREMSEAEKKSIKSKGLTVKYINVKTMTFDDVMKNYSGRSHIDFLSLDTEGAEMAILEGIDFSKYTFGLITIENNYKEGVLVHFMSERGYKVFMEIGHDIFFVHKNLADGR